MSKILSFGCFSDNISRLLNNAEIRDKLILTLLNKYFEKTKQNYLKKNGLNSGYLNSLKCYILNEPEVLDSYALSESEDNRYVRGGMFKKLIPIVYNYTCCITGMKIQSTYGHNIIDACHIIPFSISDNDRINNGICLCPNLHRAFDRGLITIDENYKIVTSKYISEEAGHPYSLSKFTGNQINLPSSVNHYPSIENFKWHNDEIFKG